MSGLLSPQPSSPSSPTLAHKASSSNMRPALTVATLGSRRRSSSVLLKLTPENPVAVADPFPPHLPEPEPEHHPASPGLSPPTFQPHLIPSHDDPPQAHTMLPIVVARALQLLHLGYKHPDILVAPSTTTPSSPRSSTDTILPLSSAPDHTSFGDVYAEKERAVRSRASWRSHPSVHAPILLVIILFPLSTALVFFALSTLPISVSWPRNLTDLAQLGRELNGYTQSGTRATAHVVGVMAVTAVWKHAWSIPGSVLWNVLAGALFKPSFATLLLTSLTTLGSLAATLLAMPLAPLITRFFPRVLAMGRNALEGGEGGAAGQKAQSPAWVRLSVLRLIGVVPWSGINIACGVCGVSLFDCALGTFIGTLPWTAVTCQIGDILQTVASQPSPTPRSISSLVASPEIIAKLVFLSFLSLAPILGRERLRTLLAPREAGEEVRTADAERAAGRWKWVNEWRVRIRVPAAAARSGVLAPEDELEVLVQEKQRREEP